jgi:adenosylhomocysteinase
MTATPHDVTDLALAEAGERRIGWALGEMPVVAGLLERFARRKPLAGLRVAACLHITAETANLLRVLQAGGAAVRACASNPLSTQDDVAAALVMNSGLPTFARRGEDTATYYRHLEAALADGPQLTLDDGADLVSTLHAKYPGRLGAVLGGMEETTTGVLRLRAMAKDGALRYPVIAVNDANTKHLFDNRYGTGQSTLDGILRATNVLLAGRCFVVVGYGWCGRGVAMRARGLGAQVVVTEVDPLRALEAVMDGYRVLPLVEAAREADLVVTTTGDKHVVDAPHFAVMKSGCILANAGHFNVEVNVEALAALATGRTVPRPNVEEFHLADGRVLRLLAEGRLVNLAAAEGHPSAVMDLSFANQALCAEWLARAKERLAPAVHEVPRAIDDEVARLKLAAMGVRIDALSAEQVQYLASWREGT